jgi:hypothetical protein
MSIKYKGMIGSKLCEQSLEEILEELDNPTLVHIVMQKLQDFKRQCKSILEIRDKRFAIEVLSMCRQHVLQQAKTREADMPLCCFTHWNCCLTAEYRETLRKLKS